MSEEKPLPKITPEDIVEKPRKIGCVTIMWVSALVFMFLFWYNGLRSVPLKISPETTYITEPLTADGKRVDYLAAFKQKVYPPEMATDDNGYRLLFQRLRGAGHTPGLSPQIMEKYCEELGLDPNHVKPDLDYRDIYAFIDHVHKMEPEALADVVQAIREERGINEGDVEIIELPAGAMGMGFSTEGGIDWHEVTRRIAESDDPHRFPVTKRWVEENGPALNLIAEAVAKSVYFVPMVSESEEEGMFESIYTTARHQNARGFARSFQLRIKYRVGVGDIDGAIDDIFACYRLGRHCERQGTMIDSLVELAIEGIAAAATVNGNLTAPASEEQLQRLAAGIRNLPPSMTMEEILELERFFVLDMIQMMPKNGVDIYTNMGFYGSPTKFEAAVEFVVDRLGYDWNIIARRYNELHNAILAGTSSAPVSTAWWPLNWLTVNSRSHELANILYNIHDMTSTYNAFREAFRRNDCHHNMKQIVLAILIYERRNGTLPPAFSVDENGKPLHSWRTFLLPYLGDESLAELYSQIKLDEPWDSEHNRQFHTQNLDIYRCPSATKKDGEANYSVIVGDELLFGNDGKGRSLDGSKRHQIMLTERKEGICWMRPDAEITQHVAESGMINSGSSSISSNHTGGANFGMRDGSVNFWGEKISADDFTGQIRGSDTPSPY